MSNLPPGVSASDIDDAYGPSVEPHDHEWVPIEEDYPIIEDGAAIFREQCHFVEILGSYTDKQRDEVYYEEGEQCEETRSVRFETAYVKFINEDEPNLTFQRSSLEWLEENDEELWNSVMESEYEVARAYNRDDDDVEVVSIDPDKRLGSVVVRLNNVEVGYGPGLVENE